MNTETFDITITTLFPCVYEPRFPSDPKSGSTLRITPTYSVTFFLPDSRLETERREEIVSRYADRVPRILVNSKKPPLITRFDDCGDYDDMVEAFAIAKSRNMPLDNLLNGVTATIEVCWFPYTKAGYATEEKWALSLRGIAVDPCDMLRIARA